MILSIQKEPMSFTDEDGYFIYILRNGGHVFLEVFKSLESAQQYCNKLQTARIAYDPE